MTKKEILETIELRQSTLKTYLNCSLMYSYIHIHKFEPEFRYAATVSGSAYHLVLQWMHEGEWDGDLESLYSKALNHYLYASSESHIPVRWKKDKQSDIINLTRNAVEILTNYREMDCNKQAIVLFSEAKFKVKVLGYEMTGTIDQVRKNPDGTVELIDFKSSAQRPNMYAVKNDLQLTLYSYAIRHGFLLVDGIWVKPNLLVDTVGIYFLRAHEVYKRKVPGKQIGDQKGDPFIRTTKDIQSLRAFRYEVRSLLSGMLKPAMHNGESIYFANTASCSFCAYKGHCVSRNEKVPVDAIDGAHALLAELNMAL